MFFYSIYHIWVFIITSICTPSQFGFPTCNTNIFFAVWKSMNINAIHISNKNPAMKSSASTFHAGYRMQYAVHKIRYLAHIAPFILLYHILFFCKQIIAFSTNLYTYQIHQQNLLLFHRIFRLLFVRPFL